jgi:hypothetical protein
MWPARLAKIPTGRRLWNPTLAQKAAQGWGTRPLKTLPNVRNGDTLFLKLIQEEVIFNLRICSR